MQLISSFFFGIAAFSLFFAGFAKSRLFCLVAGAACFLAGLAVAWIWSDQCSVELAVQLRCNPKAAISLGMGAGLWLRCLFPFSANANGGGADH